MNSRVAGVVALGIIQMCVSCMLIASEDSIDEVLEDYESPQVIFENPQTKDISLSLQQKPQEIYNSQENQSQQNQSMQIKQSLSPPRWIYSTAMVETFFNDGSLRRGFGTLLQNGFYLTSSEVIYNGRATPVKIYAKMQDDLTSNLMCVSQLSLKAIDFNSGLALLKASKSLDTYCQVRSETYYQDRIYKRFGIDVFATSQAVSPSTMTYYPYLSDMFVLVPQSIEFGNLASYSPIGNKDQGYGFFIKANFYGDFVYGRAFYDNTGVFLGITSRLDVGYLPVFINRFVVQDFLCDVQEKGIVNDENLRRSCVTYGKRRTRFFIHSGMKNLH